MLGLCYDSGHGNMGGQGLSLLQPRKDRLIAVHLHDNDGQDDQHKLIFTDTVDWPRLVRIIASSPYRKCANSESKMKCIGAMSEREFLRQAHEAGARLTGLIEAASSDDAAAGS